MICSRTLFPLSTVCFQWHAKENEGFFSWDCVVPVSAKTRGGSQQEAKGWLCSFREIFFFFFFYNWSFDVGGVNNVNWRFEKMCLVSLWHHRYWREQNNNNNKQANPLHLCSFVLCLGRGKRTLFWGLALTATKDQKYQRRLFLSGMEIILHMTHAVRVQPLCYFGCCLLTTTLHVASLACSRCAWLTSLSV